MTSSGPARSLKSRRARRTIVVGVIVFLGVQLVVAALVETRFRGWREPWFTSRVEQYQSRQAAASEACNVVVLGSSRTYYGIRADPLQGMLAAALGRPVNVFNFSTAGGGGVTAQFQWRRLKEAGPRPDLVIVDVVPILLNEIHPLLDGHLRHMPAAEMDRADIDAIVRLEPSRASLYKENILARLFPVYGHRQVLTTRLVPIMLPLNQRRGADTCAEPIEPVPHERPRALQAARADYEPALPYFRLGARHLAVVEELLRELRARGVPTLALIMPEGPIFRSWYRPGVERELTYWLEAVCRREQIVFVNARLWCDDEAWFFDSHHLTRAGGLHFSARLAKQVLIPLLAKPRLDPLVQAN